MPTHGVVRVQGANTLAPFNNLGKSIFDQVGLRFPGLARENRISIWENRFFQIEKWLQGVDTLHPDRAMSEQFKRTILQSRCFLVQKHFILH